MIPDIRGWVCGGVEGGGEASGEKGGWEERSSSLSESGGGGDGELKHVFGGWCALDMLGLAGGVIRITCFCSDLLL